MLVPKLRFKEFNDEWENYSFNDVFLLLNNNSLSRSELNYNYGDYRNIHYGDILIKYSNILDCSKSQLPFINSKIDIKKWMLLKDNDIIFADTAEDYTTGKCCELINVNNIKIIAGLHTIPCRTKIDIGSKYLGYYLNSHFYHRQLLPLITGTKVYGISKNLICSTDIVIPNNKEEEKKIGDFLSLLDKKIELQTKKIEALKLYKKGLIEKQFKKDYNLTYLSDILLERKSFSGKGLEYPHVTLSKEGIYDKGERYNRDFLVKSEEKKYKITKLNDLCYNPANLKFGVICLNEYGSAIFSPIYVTFEVKKNTNPQYLKYYLTRNNFINEVRKYEQGTVYERMAVSPEDFLKSKIKLPELSIQNAIAHNFNILDKKIFLENQKKLFLDNLKKGLMQNMFV